MNDESANTMLEKVAELTGWIFVTMILHINGFLHIWAYACYQTIQWLLIVYYEFVEVYNHTKTLFYVYITFQSDVMPTKGLVCSVGLSHLLYLHVGCDAVSRWIGAVDCSYSLVYDLLNSNGRNFCRISTRVWKDEK